MPSRLPRAGGTDGSHPSECYGVITAAAGAHLPAETGGREGRAWPPEPRWRGLLVPVTFPLI